MPRNNKRNCDYCGQYYEGQGKQFCSFACRMRHRNATDNPAHRTEVREKISQAMKGNKTCVGRIVSDETRRKISASNRGHATTPQAVEKWRATWRATAAAHGGMTPAHRAQLEAIIKRGPEHYNWKGGLSPRRRSMYYQDSRYKPFVHSVLERDDWTCQDCGQRGARLEVHHIKPWAEYPDLAFEMSNVITLCRSCHNKTKRGVPRPKSKI